MQPSVLGTFIIKYYPKFQSNLQKNTKKEFQAYKPSKYCYLIITINGL